jgi:signal transduction histidine kinase
VTLADDLRSTFLFESLSAEQLRTLAALGTEADFDTGETVFVEGQPADFLWVLLTGEMELERNIGGQRIRIATVSRPGTYGGGLQAFSGSGAATGYRATAKVARPSRFFRLPSSELGRLLAEWSPVAKHLLDGYLQRLEGIEATVRERERLISLGRLAAGLAHEVNNPAAAALRANADLRGATLQLQGAVAWLANAKLTSAQLQAILRLQQDAVGAVRPRLGSGIELANVEEKLGDWLDSHGVDNSWSVASTLASVGLDESWLETAATELPGAELSSALNWIAATLLATNLLDQVDDAVGRITQLVAAVKEYSYMDRGSEQEIKIEEGIEKTLLVLGHKLRPGIRIVREYDEHLPTIRANGAELNQVWTNLIDNAIDAMEGRGQISIRTRHENSAVIVEIGDQGPGIPSELASRIFDPFFTTKEPSKGTGLGLDIVRRIVVDGHHGEISVESKPGKTQFVVRLPVA